MDAAIRKQMSSLVRWSKHPRYSITTSATFRACRAKNQGRSRQPARYQYPRYTQVRAAHSQSRRHASSATLDLPSTDTASSASSQTSTTTMPTRFPLSCLPLSVLLRSYLITAVSSYPMLLRPSLAILSYLAHAKSPFLNPDSNPVLRALLKKTFYAQFCAGESPAEVRQTNAELRSAGYAGVILAYAREVVLDEQSMADLNSEEKCPGQQRGTLDEIKAWETGNLETVRLASEGDFVAIKFTGAGREALQRLTRGSKCGERLEGAVHGICSLAQDKGVRLLFDAEQTALQKGIDQWTVHFMREYNRGAKALVYGTYQAYLKKTPEVLATHVEMARREGWRLGVKLVRGAYMGSDPRHLMWGSIEETHRAYNGLAEAVMRMEWNEYLKGDGPLPEIDFVLASHNRESVQRAMSIRSQQCDAGKKRCRLVYGQLMGMADNVSCELVQAARERQTAAMHREVDIPEAYKYLVWGTVGECLKYLLRRAEENRDAVTRTVEGRKALGRELARRMGLGKI